MQMYADVYRCIQMYADVYRCIHSVCMYGFVNINAKCQLEASMLCQERKTILKALMQLIDKTESDIGHLALTSAGCKIRNGYWILC